MGGIGTVQLGSPLHKPVVPSGAECANSAPPLPALARLAVPLNVLAVTADATAAMMTRSRIVPILHFIQLCYRDETDGKRRACKVD
jgi:hypothetical protein